MPFSPVLPDRHWGPPSLLYNGTGFIPLPLTAVATWPWPLTTPPLPRLSMCGAVPTLPTCVNDIALNYLVTIVILLSHNSNITFILQTLLSRAVTVNWGRQRPSIVWRSDTRPVNWGRWRPSIVWRSDTRPVNWGRQRPSIVWRSDTRPVNWGRWRPSIVWRSDTRPVFDWLRDRCHGWKSWIVNVLLLK